ncbi:MAG: site-2 protease family protein [Deltaproteobacteria bacterium]|jgi:Zn-dependent protease|nr:site-2 protease family protein [Deltaproteobacteria bacterium]
MLMHSSNLADYLLLLPAVLLALTCHEYAHAWAALKLGDETAAGEGRLTLNPLSHLDVMGTIALVVTGLIGWAKPVPIDVRNFRRPTRDLSLVALAGPATNLALGLAAALALKFTPPDFFRGFFEPAAMMLGRFCVLNVGLAVFNLLPVPPLDGFKAAAYFLPPRFAAELERYKLIAFAFLIFLIWTGAFRVILTRVLRLIDALLW